MNEMMGYIFGGLKASENNIKNIRRALRKQARFNQGVATFALVIAVYVILLELNSFEQKKKIDQLSIELEGLKRVEGD